MVTILSKLFVENYSDYKDTKVRRAYGMLCSILGIFLNILLFIFKYIAGYLSGSISIIADAFNNLSDAGSSLITLIGFKFAGMKEDEEHPFGHGRIEYISGFIVSIVVILMGIELGKSSIGKIINPEKVESSLLTIVILIISVCVKLYMTVYNKRIGKKIESTAMKATSLDSLSDSVATIVVLLSILFMKITKINIDGYAGVLVAIFILYTGYNAAKETVSPLLGMKPDPELVENIEKIVLSHEEIVGIHDLIIHDYGPGRRIISLHGEVRGDGDIFELHDAIDVIENQLLSELDCEAVIHMDPIEVDNEVINKTKEEVAKLVKLVDNRITIHDFRMVQGKTHTNIIFDALIPSNYKQSNEFVKKQLEDLIKAEYTDYCPVIKIDKSYV